MKMTKEQAKEIAKKAILSSEKYGFPLTPKKVNQLKMIRFYRKLSH